MEIFPTKKNMQRRSQFSQSEAMCKRYFEKISKVLWKTSSFLAPRGALIVMVCLERSAPTLWDFELYCQSVYLSLSLQIDDTDDSDDPDDRDDSDGPDDFETTVGPLWDHSGTPSGTSLGPLWEIGFYFWFDMCVTWPGLHASFCASSDLEQLFGVGWLKITNKLVL